MQNLTLTQLSEADIRSIIRSELSAFFETLNSRQELPEDDFGGIDLAVAVTGLAKSTVYSLASKKLIPHSKKGKRLYFRRNELLDWIGSGRRKTHSEIESEALAYISKKRF